MKRILISMFALLMATVANAQIIISGTVLDESDLPVHGATLRVKGENKPTFTNATGEFSLSIQDKNATIDVTFLGYEPTSFVPGSQRTFTIRLRPKDAIMEEAVVVGFGVQKKINATGAVKTIGNDALESRPISSATQGLQGVVGGLNITNDMGGELGTEMQINIRGIGSIGEGSNSSPLILIDGMEGDLSTINPNDIENISVLKDAAASSIYGSRAPFGVILVTTKKGSQGTKVTYSGNVRFQQPINVPQMPDGYTWALMMNDAYLNSGGRAPFGSKQLSMIQAYMRGDLQYATKPSEYKNGWADVQESFGSVDWYDLFLKNVTTSQEHNFSVSGANEKVNYFFSGNYMGQTGLFNYADEKLDRLTLNAKVGVTFNKYVQFTWNTRIISIDNEKPSALGALFYHNIGRRGSIEALETPLGEYTIRSMIPSLTNGGRQRQRTRQIYNQANLVVEPIKDWKLHLEINSRLENNPYTRQFNPLYITQPDGKREAYTVLEGLENTHRINATDGSFTVYPAAGESYYEQLKASVNYFSTNVYTDYEMRLNDVHYFKFLLGEQSEYYHFDKLRVASSDILLPSKPFLPNGIGGETSMMSSKEGEWSSLGIFARINYAYDDRYMAEINLRADGASRFPTDQRWGFFPSFSAGWNIAREAFWKNLYDKGFTYLKVRASYGTLGNQNTTSFYPYYQQMQTNSGSLILGGQQATVLPMYAPYSTSLTWETIENAGVGIDWGFFNNRLTGSFDWYQRTTKDMVGPANALSAVYGADAPKTNNAELRTRGWEFEVSWRDRIGQDFSYGITFNLSDYQTTITKYDSPDGNINGWYKNKKYGDIWGYEVVGIAKSDAEMNAYLALHDQSSIGSKWGGGDLMYRDLNNDGRVDKGSQTLDDHGDLKVIGNNTPRFAYSFTLDAKWKFLDVRAFFQGIAKRDFFFTNSATFFGIAAEWQRSLFTDHLDYFRYAGAELGANLDSYFGRLRIDQNNIQVCDRFLQDASYLRLKNLQIGASLPQGTALEKYVKKARIYLSLENLFTFTNLRTFDPEAVGDFNNWGPGKTYPQYRTYSLGLELTF
ncbi:MAG: TonB-dependent receptor [Alloprevotella sp.]|nr:TonB-dependent receptor [Alloprevotella sp.]